MGNFLGSKLFDFRVGNEPEMNKNCEIITGETKLLCINGYNYVKGEINRYNLKKKIIKHQNDQRSIIN